MHCRGLIVAVIFTAAALLPPFAAAQAADDAKYPNWKGAWARFVVRGLGGQPSFDQTRPWGLGQEAPLTAEYRKVLEASLADQLQGGQGNFEAHALCLPAGMPLMMIAFRPLEFVVTPETTYVLIGGSDHYRRIFTDGRDWPKSSEATFSGYSRAPRLDWDEAYCSENSAYIAIGKDSYYLSGDGMLMPARKNQSPPDLRYFKQTQK